MRAVFLSGPGGAGKTTIAKLAQSRLTDAWLFFEVDRCHPHLSANRPAANLEDDRRMARASLRAAHAYVREGFPTLVEMDLSDSWRRAACESTFRDVPTAFVVLTARRDVAMTRVLSRGTGSEWFTWFEANYDRLDWEALPSTRTIDTSDATPDEVASQLVQFIETS